MRALRFAAAAMLLVLLSHPTLGNAPWTAPTLDDVTAALEGLTFDEFIDESFKLHLLRRPETVTSWGLSSQLDIRNTGLNNYSPEYLEMSNTIASAILDALRAIDPATLDEEQSITYDIALWYWSIMAEDSIEIVSYPLTWRESPSLDCRLERTLTRHHPISTEGDIEDYLSRLAQVERQIDQIIELLEFYQDRSIVAPRMVLEDVQHRVYLMMSTNTLRHPFYANLQSKGDEIAETLDIPLDVYLEEAASIIDAQIKPAYRRLYFAVLDVLKDSPHALPMSQFPGGEESYAFWARYYTGSDLSLERMYELASQELDRLREELILAAEAAGIEGTTSLDDIVDSVAAFSGTAIGSRGVAEAQAILDDAKALVLQEDVFAQLPTVNVEIRGGKEGGLYSSGTLDNSRPAVYYMDSFFGTPRYVLPSLTYHETIPGHHVQRARAEALDVPLLRKLVSHPAHSEGWATYAERLMDELGAYDKDPYARIGWLEGEIIAAVGVMVDIALHHFEWSLDQLQRFIVDSIGCSRTEAYGIIALVTAQPGKIMSYSFGQFEILTLREQAKEALGDAFDLKDFHDIVLGNGNVPLSFVRQQVEAWITEASTPNSGS